VSDSSSLAFVTAAARQARLDLPAERLAGLATAAAPVHELLRGLAEVDLGEAAPASSFDPSWE
jgi:hypothetical protein